MRIARIKIRVDSPGRWERDYGGNEILKRCILSLERNISSSRRDHTGDIDPQWCNMDCCK